MGFSEKMRDSLGAEGAQLVVQPSTSSIEPGATAAISVIITGGSKPAAVDALVVRLVESHRHWKDAGGTTVSEEDAKTLDVAELVPHWTKTAVAERRIVVGTTVEPGRRHEVEVELAIPDDVEPSSPACTHTVLVQADIKGQIDPTGQARITIGAPEPASARDSASAGDEPV
jgi:sporulation-control protein spo0M